MQSLLLALFNKRGAIILSDTYRLTLPVGSSLALTQPTQQTADTRGAVVV